MFDLSRRSQTAVPYLKPAIGTDELSSEPTIRMNTVRLADNLFRYPVGFREVVFRVCFQHQEVEVQSVQVGSHGIVVIVHIGNNRSALVGHVVPAGLQGRLM